MNGRRITVHRQPVTVVERRGKMLDVVVGEAQLEEAAVHNDESSISIAVHTLTNWQSIKR